MHKNYEYRSCYASNIVNYIENKRSSGFMFDNPAYWLYRFDQYCFHNNIDKAGLTKDLFETWAEKSQSETKTTQVNRLQAVKGFSLYLNSIGIASYVPVSLPKAEKNIPYLMEDSDIQSFFEQVDNYAATFTQSKFYRMAKEYAVLFRMIYCCGLRNNEACALKNEHVDTERGSLTIIHSKGNKDRTVYLSEDMCLLCQEYRDWIQKEMHVSSPWFFPGSNEEKHIVKTSVDGKFNQFWNATDVSKHSDKKPTVHSLRHAYVIKRMNSWMKNGINLNVMMPYLSRHLGHSAPSETFYYYHQIHDTFEIIRKKDKTAPAVITEVSCDED